MFRFRLLGIPVGVHWSFGFVAFLGLGVYEGWELAAWTAAVFVAVMLHESGHAFVARALGAQVEGITLFALGGLTTWRAVTPMTPGRRFVIAAAGSAVGIAAGLAVLGLGRLGLLGGIPSLGFVFLQAFVWAGLGWGILNWIPVLPLDGGHMMESLLAIVVPRRAVTIAKGVSLVVGVALIVVALKYGERFLAFFLVFIVLAGLREPSGSAPTEAGGGAETDEPVRPAPPAPPDQPRPDRPPEFPI